MVLFAFSSFFSPPTCCRFSVRVMNEPQRRKEGGKRRTLKNIALPPSRWRRCLAGEEEEERVFVANCPQHVRAEAIQSVVPVAMSPKDRLPKKRSLLFKQLLVLYRHGPNDNHKLASCLSFLLRVRSFLHLRSFF